MSNWTYVYLAGPMQGCTDEEASGWRTYVMNNLKREIVQETPSGEDIRIPKASFYFLTPMRRDYRHLATHDEVLRYAAEICVLDKVDIDKADVVFVNSPQPSYGTAMEILYAHDRGKIVVTVIADEQALSPWVAHHSTHIAPDIDSAIDWILKNVR